MTENNVLEPWRSRLVSISEEILQKLLAFKKVNPNFTFALRERDSAQSEEERLSKGQWFQGSDYIYVPLFKRGDKDRKVKTIGFVISYNDDGSLNNFVEISFKRIGDDSQLDEELHRELASKLGIQLNDINVGRRYYDNANDYMTNLGNFLEDVYPVALKLVKKHGLTDKYVVDEDSFKKRLTKINEIKSTLSAANTSIKTSPETGLKNNNFPMQLNLILYGPPGTGKTYNSIDYAVKIAKGVSGKHSDNKDIFDDLRKEGQIEFVTFHQNYTYEDFIVSIRPDVDSSNLRFVPYKGIFYQLCKRARENYESSQSNTSLESYENLVQDMLSGITDEKPLEFKTVRGKPFWLTDFTDRTIYLKKSTGSEIHSLSIPTLIELAEEKREMVSGLSVYYQPIIEFLKNQRKPGKSGESLKRYVLIIDEINRANISKVFGELITLLEEDKRIDGDNELRVTLPNGEKDFAIPPNLYLIGTMNTADKSIALIDIALRRRFEFIGKYPDYEVLKVKSPASAKLLEMINIAIYKKKNSADFLIGHAYFLKDLPIKDTLSNKVIPLLMEYFSGKTEIISEIFTGTGWKVKYNVTNFLWDIDQESNA